MQVFNFIRIKALREWYAKKNLKMGILSAYATTFLEIISPVILIPLLIVQLSAIQISFWYTASATIIIIRSLDTPLRNAIILFVSKIKCGDTVQAVVRQTLIIYAGFILIGMTLSYQLYFQKLYIQTEFFICWVLLCIASFVNLISLKHTLLLISNNLIEKTYFPEAISKIFFTLSGSFALVYYSSIQGLFISLCISSFILLFLIIRASKRYLSFTNSFMGIQYLSIKGIYKIILRVAPHTIASNVVARAPLLLLAGYVNHSFVSQWGLTQNLFNLTHRFSLLPVNHNVKKIYDIYNQNVIMKPDMKFIFFLISVILLLAFMGSIFIIYLIPNLLLLVEANTMLLDRQFLLVFSISLMFAVLHDFSTHILFSKADTSYVFSNVIAGFLVIGLQYYFIINTMFFMVAAVQLMINIMYNYWKWPLKAYYVTVYSGNANV